MNKERKMINSEIEKKIEDLEEIAAELREIGKDRLLDPTSEIKEIEEKINELKNQIYKNLTPWDRVELARHPKRPTAMNYIENIFTDFIELKGDRYFRDDKSTICGIARIDKQPYTIIAQQKGRNTKENIERNFGMPNPESYRKAIRIMKQAEKFKRPIVTFIDTKGAYPGIGAEERGQGEAIARNLYEMSNIKVPIIVVVIGEGSSGGALAIGVGDKIFMLENAIYSILSPEGYASILWKDTSRTKEAAEIMKLTAKDLYELNIIDEIIEEPLGGAQNDLEQMCKKIKKHIVDSYDTLKKIPKEELIEKRYKKYRNI
jgi:acetyl-CoA carboxylase carboxyl transferase subunit alpha